MSWFNKFWKRPTKPMEAESVLSDFTPLAQQSLALARKEADRLNQSFVATEHLLSGLVALSEGTAVAVLEKMGIKPETIRTEIERCIGAEPEEKVAGNVPYTPRVKKALVLAAQEAKSLNHLHVSTGHILLGLLQADGVAARILRNLKVDVTRTRYEVLKELERASPRDRPGSAQTEPGPGLQNFTPRAQKVLALSRKEAERFNHNFVGTEHLLLGLIALDQGTAVDVLRKMGLNLELVRAEVEKQVGTGPEQKMIGTIPFTPRVRKVFALADKERKALNHTYLGTEHILLGILREGDGVAARVLKNLDIDIEKTRCEILKELDPNYQPPAAADSPSEPTAMKTKTAYDPIDTSVRYDVYCREHGDKIVVYRNALFKNGRSLFRRSEFDVGCEFIELEQSSGQTIFISRLSLVRFCPHGVKMEGEELSGDKPPA
jgi:ATP-dependent Clp protease ATP-binding subunit ClpA